MKGYQRKVIFLKNTGSPYFDEAYFVISNDGIFESVEQSDMVLEANRIINESFSEPISRIKRERVRKIKEFLLPFFLGVIISIFLAFILFLVFEIF